MVERVKVHEWSEIEARIVVVLVFVLARPPVKFFVEKW